MLKQGGFMGGLWGGLWGGMALALLLSTAALAQEVEISGSVTGEARWFPHHPKFTDQDDRHLEPSVAVQPEFRMSGDWLGSGGSRVTVIPFYRYDPADVEERTHFDLREANLYVENDGWDVTAGLGKVFWGTTESRHLVDIVNQSDLAENPDGEDKLGQPMVHLTLLNDWGTVGLFVLPGFRERTFVGDQARLRGATPVDESRTEYESSAENKHVDFAARYSHYFGDWDVGISHFHGTSREPRFEVITQNDGTEVLAPIYDQIDQTGLDLQYTTDAWLWKAEAIRHSGFRTSDGFYAAVGGFEYTLYGVADSDVDLGLLAEFMWDGRKAGAAGTLFQRDVFTGMRFDLNDAASTTGLVGLITDIRSGESIARAEFEHRLGESLKLELEAGFGIKSAKGSAARDLSDDGNLSTRLVWYF